MIYAINATEIGLKASINKGRDAILIADTRGQSGQLIVANGDGSTETADRLGIAFSGGASTVAGQSLDLQVINENTKLSSLNGGAGVAQGFLTITDTNGVNAKLQVTSGLQTVGDLIDEVTRLGLGVQARINDAGDGIVLVDTLHGSGTLTVTEGNSTTAANLRLLSPPRP